MEADSQFVNAEPRPGGHDIASNRQDGQPSSLDHAVPAGMQDERVPNHNDQRAIFLGIPAPESAPRIVSP